MSASRFRLAALRLMPSTAVIAVNVRCPKTRPDEVGFTCLVIFFMRPQWNESRRASLAVEQLTGLRNPILESRTKPRIAATGLDMG